MEFVNLENVAVILAGQEIYVINYRATADVPNMVNVKMVLVSALKDGMDVIAHYVSLLFPKQYKNKRNFFGCIEIGKKGTHWHYNLVKFHGIYIL